ncbi:MAG TPA: FKBP-type peptidyl-prolyl cis-trans isomerase [Cyclobacteriaceae bacterium]|nr:FKBP-type peptidyl-prolyl cis-trans isomerase [Cyclobacteriaceae bacterium]HRW98238.1 FKBP-type peptidyl-prolyl cis-trans isomerase [Cyclobacteriaceae bacterium]
MRYFIALTLFTSQLAFAQSKKELAAEVEKLNQQVSTLKAEITDLKTPKKSELVTEHQKASYGLGVLMASNLKNQGSDSIDVNILTEAMRDILTDGEVQMDEQEAMGIVQPYMTRAMEQRTEKMKAKGRDFLAENKSKEGVKTTESGLQYRVINSGAGKMPTADQSVTVHYTGKLIDGTVFDSSVERGEPATFGVSQVIDGWTEALQLMKEGDKWELFIPSELAYGERGAGGRIPPYSTLIFEVELIKVNQ